MESSPNVVLRGALQGASRKTPAKAAFELRRSANSLKQSAGAGGFEPPHGGIKVRTQPNVIKGHSDSSRHVDAIVSQSLKARVRTTRPNDLCVECAHRTRPGSSRLSRCIPCIKAEAARARDASQKARARWAAAREQASEEFPEVGKQ